jgi:hypothetical protein
LTIVSELQEIERRGLDEERRRAEIERAVLELLAPA